MSLPKREFLQQAQTYNPKKHCIAGYFASEKLDGMRCLWDGGMSLSMYADEIDFANTSKDHKLRESRVLCTGLWSRTGKVIRCPEWFGQLMPMNIPLDGELYLGPGRFQELVSIVKRHEPDERWKQVKFKVFDVPSDAHLFQDGRIHTNLWSANFCGMYPGLRVAPRERPRSFVNVIQYLDKISKDWDANHMSPLWQTKLAMSVDTAREEIDDMMETVLDNGGEGIVLRKPESIWTPKRSWDVLKYKSWHDAEGTVIGYNWGKGKLEGLMGTIVVLWEGKQFKVSGFTDAERMLVDTDTGVQVANGEPGSVVDNTTTYSSYFLRGTKITFKYRELTMDQIPKEARYFRKPA